METRNEDSCHPNCQGACSECATALPASKCEECGGIIEAGEARQHDDAQDIDIHQRACGEYLPEHEDDCDREFMALRVRVSTEAMSLFAPLSPCPECQRPLPVPFNDDYRHWAGCSIAEREVAA